MKGFIFILLISSSIIAQERKIEKHVYLNFNQGNIDLALEELEKLSPKYETEAFFYYWKAYIYIEKLNAYKKNSWIESDRYRCINLIKSIKEFLDNASLRLTKDQLKIDKEEFNILFPGCEITPPNNEKKYTNCVDLLKSKFIQLKVSMDELITNLSFEDQVNKRIASNKDLNELIVQLKPKIALNYPANPLLGEINKELFLKAAAARNNLELKKMEQDQNDDNWLNYLRTKTAEEYLSIVPQIEALINNYFLQKLEVEYDKVKNNVYALTTYLSNLEENKNFLEANPNNYFSSKYTGVNLSNTFKNLHKGNFYVVINKAKVQQQENLSRQKLFENEIDYSQVIEDNFDQNVRGWYLSENETAINKIANGKFIFENKYDGGYINIASIRMPTNINNFIFSMNTTWVSGIVNNSYHIIWGANGFSNYFSFGITANGLYRYSNINNGNYQDVIPLTASEHINRSGSNVIGVKKNGSTIELYINDYKVNQIEFTQFYGDQLGMSISGKQRIEFDDFKLKYNLLEIEEDHENEPETAGDELLVQNNVQEEVPIKNGPGLGVKDIDGNKYKTVYIGTQEWMAENLRVTKYNDGKAIPNVKDDSEWGALNDGAWVYYDNAVSNNIKYGKLYNWYAASSNLCPTGWHLPTSDDWSILINYLGGEDIAGGKMKEVGTTSWKSPNQDYATNTSLFTGRPGGYRSGYSYYSNYGELSGVFGSINEYGNWWSSTTTEFSESADYVSMSNESGRIESSYVAEKKQGFSIRCVKD